MIACNCAVCQSPDPANQRLRSSIMLETKGVRLIVDTTPDFRQQCLRSKIQDINAIFYTHEHSDHLLGLDELRRFCVVHDKRLPVYGSKRVLEYIERIFPYAILNPPPYKGLPELDLHEVTGPFSFHHLKVVPYRMPHGSTQSLGYRFEDDRGVQFAYLTDCKEVSSEIRQELRKIPLLILDALRHKPHPTHLSISEALEVVNDIQPGKTFFTHIAHEVDHHRTNSELPANVSLAYDTLSVEI
jgi:phosphoribosyl 1,2-cyclic phosphate phosphodiesterase